MTTTAGEVAEKALKRILVQASEAPLESDDYADFLEGMNDFMLDLEASGIRLGYTAVDNIADVVTVPPGAIRGIVANMAIEVAPDYNAQVSPALANQAKRGMSTLMRLGSQVSSSRLPSTLPMGSGYRDSSYSSGYYYNDTPEALMTLAGNAVVTSFAVTNTPYLVSGFWTVKSTASLRADISGRITNVSTSEIDLDVDLSFSATGDSTYTFRLMKSGVSQEIVTWALTTTPQAIVLLKFLTLAPGEYLELWVEDDSATENAVITQAQFKVS